MKTEIACDDHYSEFEGNGDKYKNSSLAEYLEEIRSYFKEMIDNFITSNQRWETQMTWKLLFISSKYTDDERVCTSKVKKLQLWHVNYLVKIIFHSFISAYPRNLFEKMKSSDIFCQCGLSIHLVVIK